MDAALNASELVIEEQQAAELADKSTTAQCSQEGPPEAAQARPASCCSARRPSPR